MNNKIKNWKKMPKEKPLAVVSWEDVYYRAQDMGHDLTRDEVIEIFDNIDRYDFDCEFGTFWGTIDQYIESFVSEKEKENEDDEEEDDEE